MAGLIAFLFGVFFSLTINTNFVYSFFSVPSLQTIVVMFVFIVSEKALHRLGKKMMRLTAMRPWKWKRFLSFILLVSVSLSFSLSLSPYRCQCLSLIVSVAKTVLFYTDNFLFYFHPFPSYHILTHWRIH